jgi:hypothetical protein
MKERIILPQQPIMDTPKIKNIKIDKNMFDVEPS